MTDGPAAPGELVSQAAEASADFVASQFVMQGAVIDDVMQELITTVATGVLAWLATRAEEAGVTAQVDHLLLACVNADQALGRADDHSQGSTAHN